MFLEAQKSNWKLKLALFVELEKIEVVLKVSFLANYIEQLVK